MNLPAPVMTAKRLAEIARAITPYPGKELFAYIDTLHARVATLETELAAARKVEDGEVEKTLSFLALLRHEARGEEADLVKLSPENCTRISDLLTRQSAALAAARKVDDGEIASAIIELSKLGWEGDEGEVGPRCADLLTRLSAELKEAKADTYRLAEELAGRNDTKDTTE